MMLGMMLFTVALMILMLLWELIIFGLMGIGLIVLMIIALLYDNIWITMTGVIVLTLLFIISNHH